MRQRDHIPAPPQTIGTATGLVYCMACGFLLASDERGSTTRADKPCSPIGVGYR